VGSLDSFLSTFQSGVVSVDERGAVDNRQRRREFVGKFAVIEIRTFAAPDDHSFRLNKSQIAQYRRHCSHRMSWGHKRVRFEGP